MPDFGTVDLCVFSRQFRYILVHFGTFWYFSVSFCLFSIQKLPVPNDPLGFIELFKFWWEQKGQYLPQDDMERFFKLPLTFARQQAQKGVFIDSQYVEYQEEPLLLN